jgi:dTMP kinase
VPSNLPGKLIVVEGPDGSGKSTLVRLLAPEAARILKCPVVRCAQPSDGPIGLLLRQILRRQVRLSEPSSEALVRLFAADRADQFEGQMRSHLEAGGVVICDRYDLSTLIYNVLLRRDELAVLVHRLINNGLLNNDCSARLSDVDRQDLRDDWRLLNRGVAAVGVLCWVRRPDLTLVLQVSPEVAQRRMSERKTEQELFEGAVVQRRVVEFYRAGSLMMSVLAGDRTRDLDGDQPVNDVLKEAVEHVRNLAEENS